MTKQHLFAGIDPGMTGAICLYYPNGTMIVINTPYVEGEPDIPAIMNLLADCTSVTIENVHSMPKQGIASTSKFMRQFGMILGALIYHSYLNKMEINLVSPSVWKKRILGHGKHEKSDSIKKALETVSEQQLLRTPRCKTLDHNRAEAVLLCLYGMQIGLEE